MMEKEPINASIYHKEMQKIEDLYNEGSGDISGDYLSIARLGKAVIDTYNERRKSMIEDAISSDKLAVRNMLKAIYGDTVAYKKYSYENFGFRWNDRTNTSEIIVYEKDRQTGNYIESNELDVGGFKFEHVDQVVNFPDNLKVRRLSIENCGVERLGNLPNGLEVLNCNNNNLRELSGTGDLVELYCSNNKLEQIIDSMPQLRHLNCSRNKLSNLPKIESIKVLNCSHNNISYIPRWQYLRQLSCSYNQINIISMLRNLHVLDCRFNPVVLLSGLDSLRILKTEGTGITPKDVEKLNIPALNVSYGNEK